jgi:thiazole/oxazole-forming peptide maturase SagD family component
VSRALINASDVLQLIPDVQLLSAAGRPFGFGAAGSFFTLDDLDPVGLRDVLAALDGERSVAEVVSLLEARYQRADILSLLEQLSGVVVQRVEQTEQANRSRLDDSPILVLGSGALAKAVERELARVGFSRIDVGEALVGGLSQRMRGYALVVSALEDVLGQTVLDVSRAALDAERIAIFAAIEGERYIAGPLVVPGKSACFACSRLSTTLRAESDGAGPSLLSQFHFGHHRGSAHEWQLCVVATAVARDAARAVLGTPYPELVTTLLRADSAGEINRPKLGGVTSCTVCAGFHGGAKRGKDAERPPSALSRDDLDVRDRAGGVRSVSAGEALLRARRALERLGVEVACRPLGQDAPERLLAVECPYFDTQATPRFSASAPLILPVLRSNCYGKGTTAEQAECSALFEWIERHLSAWRGDKELVTASYREVRDRAIDMRFLASSLLPGLPLSETRLFDEDEPIDFVWGHCLRTDRAILLPAASVFMCPTLFRGSLIELPAAGSSGLSAGCSFAEALLQGLLELVERDACHTALRNACAFPQIDARSITDEAVCSLLERAARAGYACHLRDVTSDIRVPAIEAFFVCEEEYVHHYQGGFGSHLDPDIALRRAVTEAAQALFYDASEGNDSHETAAASAFRVFPYRKQALEQKGPLRSMSELPRREGSVWSQIDQLVTLVAAAIPRADICVVDLTPPWIEGVQVVRTFVSGVLTEVRDVQIHIPDRCRLLPLGDMYLGSLPG